ncbi:MAG TPA: hypothetical protein VI636_02055 [Candidatus Angelobacter sp.]
MTVGPNVRPHLHSRRVESWIYTIVNPLIDAMRNEVWWLDKRNLSWRFYSRRAEYIRPICDYIEPHNLPNLEDFLADNETFKSKFEGHDKTLQIATDRAATFFDILISGQIFKDQVNQSLEEYEASGTSAQPNKTSLDSMKADLPQYVAENLVNSLDFLPNHYTTHKFWELFGPRFRAQISEFEGYKQRPSYSMLQEAVENLADLSTELLRDLEGYRLRICREFDIPAAQPIASASSQRLSR